MLSGVFLGVDGVSTDTYSASHVQGLAVGGEASVKLCDVQLCCLRIGIYSFGTARLDLNRCAVLGASISLVLDDSAAITLRNTSLSTDVAAGDEAPDQPPSDAADDGAPDHESAAAPTATGCMACLSPAVSVDAADVTLSGAMWAPGGARPANITAVRCTRAEEALAPPGHFAEEA